MPILSILDLVRVTRARTRAQPWTMRATLAAHGRTVGLLIASGWPSTTTCRYCQRGNIPCDRPTLRQDQKRFALAAGGIMLAEPCPDRDCGTVGTPRTPVSRAYRSCLGRAPGTDQITIRALRTTAEASERFPQDVMELQAFLGPLQAGPARASCSAAGTNVPLWILGSSHFGAMLAAELGLPYAFASPFRASPPDVWR